MDTSLHQTHWNASAVEIAQQFLKDPSGTYVGEMKKPDGTSRIVLYSKKPTFLDRISAKFRRIIPYLFSNMQMEAFHDSSTISKAEHIANTETHKKVFDIFQKALESPAANKKDREIIEKAQQNLSLLLSARAAVDTIVDSLATRSTEAYCPVDYERNFHDMTVTVKTSQDNQPVTPEIVANPSHTKDLLERSTTQPQENQEYMKLLVKVLEQFPISETVMDDLRTATSGNELSNRLVAHQEQLPFSLELFFGCCSQMIFGCVSSQEKLVNLIMLTKKLPPFGSDSHVATRSYDIVISKNNGSISEIKSIMRVGASMTFTSGTKEPRYVLAGTLVFETTISPTPDRRATQLAIRMRFEEPPTPPDNKDVALLAKQCQEHYHMEHTYTIEQGFNSLPSPQPPST